MFLKFNTAEQRRAYGGSMFVELQYCRLPVGTSGRELVSISAIRFWDTASLYICFDEMDAFCSEYKSILDSGANSLDLYGINYYSALKTEAVIKEIEAKKPCEHEVLLKWLRENPYHNGFYILGV